MTAMPRPVAITDANERTLWLRDAVAQRVAAIAAQLPFVQHAAMVVTGLIGPVPEPGTAPDWTCDRCGVDASTGMTTFMLCEQLGDVEVRLCGGLCPVCATAEGWPTDAR